MSIIDRQLTIFTDELIEKYTSLWDRISEDVGEPLKSTNIITGIMPPERERGKLMDLPLVQASTEDLQLIISQKKVHLFVKGEYLEREVELFNKVFSIIKDEFTINRIGYISNYFLESEQNGLGLVCLLRDDFVSNITGNGTKKAATITYACSDKMNELAINRQITLLGGKRASTNGILFTSDINTSVDSREIILQNKQGIEGLDLGEFIVEARGLESLSEIEDYLKNE